MIEAFLTISALFQQNTRGKNHRPWPVSKDQVGSLNFHPHLAIMRCPSRSPLWWYQRRPNGASELLLPLPSNNEVSLLIHSYGNSGGHVRSQHFDPHASATRHFSPSPQCQPRPSEQPRFLPLRCGNESISPTECQGPVELLKKGLTFMLSESLTRGESKWNWKKIPEKIIVKNFPNLAKIKLKTQEADQSPNRINPKKESWE